ncbi:kinesin-like protein KIF20B isoform X2 [Gouania willdenowi]|uniref:kinesin-like protein KIF20B isoform X2 n=2 Tax=Gouania willdenowi TaxID=441366 RepID=UPI001055B811|nr:kinesin-like protein KIF20B isoform X2 [Gouania willdenowi]
MEQLAVANANNNSGFLNIPHPMMESCLNGKPEHHEPIEVEDICRNLQDEFAALPAQDVSQSENLQVYLRIRPITAAEGAESQSCVRMEGSDTVILRDPRSFLTNRQGDKPPPQTAQRFTFTQVFAPESSQRTVFEGSVHGLVRDVIQGGNSLVFTYGVTNAGKTFTFVGPEHDSGLLPRSLSAIFSSIEGRLYSRSDLKPQRCRDYSRLTAEQQTAQITSKRNLLRLWKESEKSSSGRSAFLEGSSLSTDSGSSFSECDSFSLDVSSNVKFSVWVSFCEIYNDNIHDLLEQVPNGHHKRAVLRLSQDVKGNSFIKDLRWVQVSSSEEAYRVMKIGRRNQSVCSTRLNHQSSRSHSIFSIRILRVDDVGVPRVLGISELVLCDLAGSERCSRTQNTGERLKEAGNINSSLLTLGKCIHAMKLNQTSKFQHHVPFRESKLTHFLQFFFCGAGRVSMVVNISQNSFCFDETVNVLKFSALAQKVVVLNSRSSVPDGAPHRSALELSMIIDEEMGRSFGGKGRKSSMVAWETNLEDVMEDEDGEEEEEEEEESVMEGTVLEAEPQEEDQIMEEEADKEAELRLVLEAHIREEVSAEFMELFNNMEKDYRERLEMEKQLLEERAEKRVDILKNLIAKMGSSSEVKGSLEEQSLLKGIICSMSDDLIKIRQDAECVTACLHTHTQELETLRLEKQQSHDQLQKANEMLRQQQLKVSELMKACEQKDDVISELQTALNAERVSRSAGEEEEQSRQRDDPQEERRRGAARSREILEEEIWRLQEENDKKEETIARLMEREEGWRRRREEDVKVKEEELRKKEEELLKQKEENYRLEEQLKELKEELVQLESKVEELSDLDRCVCVCPSLEEKNKNLDLLHTQVSELRAQLTQHTDRLNNQSEQLTVARTRLQQLESQSEEKSRCISSLKAELLLLQREEEEKENRRRDKPGGQVLSSPPQSSNSIVRRTARGTAKKRKSYEVEELMSSDSKRNRLKNPQLIISPQSLRPTAHMVPEHSSKPQRRQRKLYNAPDALLDSPLPSNQVAIEEEMESDHMIITRNLRSKKNKK